MNLVGKVDGVTYMLPFYNYAMGLTYRKDLVNDPKEQQAFMEKYGIELRVPETWDEYMKQVEFFTYVRPAGTVLPDPASTDRYDRHYALYRELYDRLAPFYPRLATS